MAVHAQTTCTLSTIPAKTSLLKGHFLYSDGYANVIEYVDNSSSNWKSNVHIGANGIQLRYNNIVLSEWAAKTITPTGGGASIDPNFTFYYPKENTNTGVVSQGLSALKLSTGGMSLYRDSDTNENENIRKLFDLGSSGLIFYSGETNPTPIARFNGSGVQIGKDGVVNAYITSNSFVLRNENVSPIRTFFKVKDGLVGEGSHTDSFIGDEIKVKFDLTYNADSSTYTVKKNNIEVSSSEVNKTTSYFTFNNAPEEGDVITATYNVTRPSISSCTFGIRDSSSIEGDYSVAEGFEVIASGPYSHTEGKQTEANGSVSHAEGNLTKADGTDSHAEGHATRTIGGASHAEGAFTIANGNFSHAEGSYTKASGYYSHAEGHYALASGETTHAEGRDAKAIGPFSHAEGINTEAIGYNSHVEGFYSKVTVTGDHSHAEGLYTTASHIASHAGGRYTQTSRDSQTVIGEYNKDDTSALFIIGNGTSGESSDRKNAFTVDTSGNVNIQSGAKYKINGTALSASDVGALPTRPASIEFQPSSSTSNNGGFIDFHYNRSTADYTSRIIESASGVLTITGELCINNHSSSIGTVKVANASAKTANNNTNTNLTSISLEAGTWVVTGGVRFPANATGYRRMNISTTSAAGAADVQLPAVNGASTQLTYTLVVSPTATTTYYLNCYQNSGSDMSLIAGGGENGINFIRAVRIA